MPANYALESIDLGKSFGQTRALHALNLAIPKGEVLCLLGANGAGKSTTINLFLGFLKPDTGRALVNGTCVAESPSKARQQLAYLPEAVALYPKLTGLENLVFFEKLAGGKRSEEDLMDFLVQVGLPPQFVHRATSTYSKGMRQKVGIAIAMARGAGTLLLDEPLSGLDPSAANSLCQQIGKLRDDGCAVLMATHDIFRAKEVGDRIGIMMGGELVNLLDTQGLNANEIESIYLEHLHESNAA